MLIETRMGIVILFFESIEDLSRYIEQQLVEAKSTLLSQSRRLSEAQKRFDMERVGQDTANETVSFY